jgi:hypothetical protein
MGTMPWLLLAVRLSLLSAVQAKEESLVIAASAENVSALGRPGEVRVGLSV